MMHLTARGCPSPLFHPKPTNSLAAHTPVRPRYQPPAHTRKPHSHFLSSRRDLHLHRSNPDSPPPALALALACFSPSSSSRRRRPPYWPLPLPSRWFSPRDKPPTKSPISTPAQPEPSLSHGACSPKPGSIDTNFPTSAQKIPQKQHRPHSSHHRLRPRQPPSPPPVPSPPIHR